MTNYVFCTNKVKTKTTKPKKSNIKICAIAGNRTRDLSQRSLVRSLWTIETTERMNLSQAI